MNDAWQIIFIISFIFGIIQGYSKLCSSSALTTKEPDIYFIITDLYNTK